MPLFPRWAVALPLVSLLAVAGCASGTPSSAAEQDRHPFTFAVVTHGQTGDAFWDVVKKGAEQAGADEGVQVTYQGDGDPQKQSQLIDAAVNQRVDGLVVSMANPPALKAAIGRATAAGIAVITINSGQAASKEVGALTHVGQDEIVAGRGAGERLRATGVTRAICVIHEAGNIALEQRCDGFREGLGGAVENLQVQLADPAGAQAAIKAKLQTDPSIDGVLTVGPIGSVAPEAVAEAGSKATIATFDLNADITRAIQDGKILFAVDQQQYVQGYLPIVMLTLFKSNLNTVGGGLPVLTGPGYVDKAAASQVAELSRNGTR